MTKLQHLRPLLLCTSQQQRCHENYRKFASSSSSKNDPPDDSENPSSKNKKRPTYIPQLPRTIDDISEPTTCCMSGCANCVWIEYAEKLSTVLKGSPGDVQKTIMDKVQDPNMRAFLSMELRVRKLID